MQNNTVMIAQKMMARQSPYGPIGMVSQDMSGNKKGGGGAVSIGLLGLNFNPANITTGLTLANNNTTVTNSTASAYTSAVGNAATNIGDTSVYWEFVWGNGNDQWCGFAISTFNANHANAVGNTVGQAANTCAIRNNVAQWGAASASISSGVTFATGDVLGLWLQMTASTINVTYYKNGALVTTRNFSAYLTLGNTVSYVPAWSSWSTGGSSTLSNYLYAAPTGATVLTSPNTSALITASASVPAVADGAYDVYTFNASGTFTVGSTGNVLALVIAGGGAGGQTYGAGGAGGYQEKGTTITPQTYAITVGAGGAGQPYTGNNQSLVSNNGNNSAFSAITAIGGGGGGSYSDTTATVAKTGGSGGGGSLILGGNVSGAAGTTGQGFNGGNAFGSGVYGGGGGGGSFAAGSDGTALAGGNGGAGSISNITGTNVTRAGGGGGSFFGPSGTIGTGGAGGGGDGASTGVDAAGVGVGGAANTGGGGGGSHSLGNTSTSASGGSGVVVIRVRARA
jgi:hypothetical protein